MMPGNALLDDRWPELSMRGKGPGRSGLRLVELGREGSPEANKEVLQSLLGRSDERSMTPSWMGQVSSEIIMLSLQTLFETGH